VVGQWYGSAPAGTQETATAAVGELLARDGESMVLDLGRLTDVCDVVLQTLVKGMNEAQRLGRSVCLVQCSEDLYRRLQRSGVAGAVTHAASLVAATCGLASDPASTLDLYLRSSPEFLCRLRSVIAVMAREAGLSTATEFELKSAVTEAAANAIRHGSPEGSRNHVRVSFHLDHKRLVVDIEDQGRGFDPDTLPVPNLDDLCEGGYGLPMMRRLMDRVEFYRDARGMLVRMTKFI
jgi:serine/threonine-protein kinase RsbW